MIAADITDNFSAQSEAIKRDLERADGRAGLPVNLIYPASYPDAPAILLESVISPGDVLEALSRVEGSTRIAANRDVKSGI